MEEKSGEKPEGSGGEGEFEVVEHTDVPDADSEEVQSSLPPEVTTEEKPAQAMQTAHPDSDTINPQVC